MRKAVLLGGLFCFFSLSFLTIAGVLLTCLCWGAEVRLKPGFFSTSTGAVSWGLASIWDSGAVPTAQDDVVIPPIPCKDQKGGTVARYLVLRRKSTTPFVAKSLRFGCNPTVDDCDPSCSTVLWLQDGITLSVVESVTLSYSWAFVALSAGAVVSAGDNVTVTAGVLQGFGTVSAPTFVATGASSHIAPGKSVYPGCSNCVPGWTVVGTADATGELTIQAKSATIRDGASIWIKLLPPAPSDKLTFAGLLSLNSAQINLVATAAGPPVSSIAFDFLAPNSNWNVSGIPGQYPWSRCACFDCGAVQCDAMVSPPNSDFSGACSTQGPGAILVGIETCDSGPMTEPPAITCATMSPQCVRGDCLDRSVGGPVCLCPAQDDRGFGFAGQFCEQPYCGGNCGGAAQGSCVWTSPDALPHCVCNSAWQGDSCLVPLCQPPCANGTCVVGGGGVTVCNCAPGWQGATCEMPLPVDTCPDCSGRGDCSAATNFTCNCTQGYSGSSCAIPLCPGSGCSGNGVCQPDFPPVCNCALQWTGSACSTRQCAPGDCLNGAACSVSANQPSCTCAYGWTGSQCQLVAFSANGTMTATPAAAASIVGLAVGVAVGVAAAGVLVALAIWLIHRHRTASHTLSVNKHLAQKSLVELERHKSTGNFG
jgi:hypothetical protein